MSLMDHDFSLASCECVVTPLIGDVQLEMLACYRSSQQRLLTHTILYALPARALFPAGSDTSINTTT